MDSDASYQEACYAVIDDVYTGVQAKSSSLIKSLRLEYTLDLIDETNSNAKEHSNSYFCPSLNVATSLVYDHVYQDMNSIDCDGYMRTYSVPGFDLSNEDFVDPLPRGLGWFPIEKNTMVLDSIDNEDSDEDDPNESMYHIKEDPTEIPHHSHRTDIKRTLQFTESTIFSIIQRMPANKFYTAKKQLSEQCRFLADYGKQLLMVKHKHNLDHSSDIQQTLKHLTPNLIEEWYSSYAEKLKNKGAATSKLSAAAKHYRDTSFVAGVSKALHSYNSCFCRRCFLFDCQLHLHRLAPPERVPERMLDSRDLPQCRSSALPATPTKKCYLTLLSPRRRSSFVEESLCDWKFEEGVLCCALVDKIFEKNFCIVSEILRRCGFRKSCREVFFLVRQHNLLPNVMPVGMSPGSSLRAIIPENGDSPNGHNHDGENRQRGGSFSCKGSTNQKSTWRKLNRIIYQDAKKGQRYFLPCTGECQGSAKCNCGHVCEKFCQCLPSCPSRYPGCACKSTCSSFSCPCLKACRECDPDLCVSCGANQTDLSKQDVMDLKLCRNVSIQRKWWRNLLVGRSTVAGFGCFANETIEKNDLLMEYCGELVSQMEGERSGVRYDRLGCSFLFNLNADFDVDAMYKGNIIRFANHSRYPNCFTRIMMVNGDHRIGIYAKEAISRGEELFFDYQYNGEQVLQFVPIERRSTGDGCRRQSSLKAIEAPSKSDNVVTTNGHGRPAKPRLSESDKRKNDETPKLPNGFHTPTHGKRESRPIGTTRNQSAIMNVIENVATTLVRTDKLDKAMGGLFEEYQSDSKYLNGRASIFRHERSFRRELELDKPTKSSASLSVSSRRVSLPAEVAKSSSKNHENGSARRVLGLDKSSKTNGTTSLHHRRNSEKSKDFKLLRKRKNMQLSPSGRPAIDDDDDFCELVSVVEPFPPRLRGRPRKYKRADTTDIQVNGHSKKRAEPRARVGDYPRTRSSSFPRPRDVHSPVKKKVVRPQEPEATTHEPMHRRTSTSPTKTSPRAPAPTATVSPPRSSFRTPSPAKTVKHPSSGKSCPTSTASESNRPLRSPSGSQPRSPEMGLFSKTSSKCFTH